MRVVAVVVVVLGACVNSQENKSKAKQSNAKQRNAHAFPHRNRRVVPLVVFVCVWRCDPKLVFGHLHDIRRKLVAAAQAETSRPKRGGGTGLFQVAVGH